MLTIPPGRIELPAAGLSALAYVLLIVLVGILTRVAVALVKEGTSLVRQAAPCDGAATGKGNGVARAHKAVKSSCDDDRSYGSGMNRALD